MIRERDDLNFLFLHFVAALHLDLGSYSRHYFGFGKLSELLQQVNNFPVVMVTHYKKLPAEVLPAASKPAQKHVSQKKVQQKI